MKNKLFEKALAEVPEETKVFVRKYTDIVDRINYLLKEKGINQKQLAQKMGKRESEISKWLKSGQNLTLKSIAKLEVALGEEIIAVPRHEVTYPTWQRMPSESLKITLKHVQENRFVTERFEALTMKELQFLDCSLAS